MSNGARGISNLRYLCYLLYTLSTHGRSFLMDNGKCVRYIYAFILLYVYEKRELAEKEDLRLISLFYEPL